MNLDADKAANIKGSTVVAGKDINITGENVKIENSDRIYNAQEKHEFERSGLSVSIGEKVTSNVVGDLNIEIKQDKNSYEEKNSSAGFGIGIDLIGQNKKDGQDNLDKKTRLTILTRQVSLVVQERAMLTANMKA